MIEEIWKPIEGYPNYEVSNLGRVRSLNYNKTNQTKILTPWNNGSGYKLVGLRKDGKRKMFQVHRLVAIAFINNPNNYQIINHKDENPSNNYVENLEWCTHKYNLNYGTRNERISQKLIINSYMLGRFSKLHHNSKPINQYTKDGIFIRSWDCTADVERELGFKQQNIGRCALGKRKSSHGFIWRYKEDKAA